MEISFTTSRMSALNGAEGASAPADAPKAEASAPKEILSAGDSLSVTVAERGLDDLELRAEESADLDAALVRTDDLGLLVNTAYTFAPPDMPRFV